MVTNVADIVKKGLCAGCGVCELACPFHAIEMVYDKSSGTHYPSINTHKCNNCGLCLKVCFGAAISSNYSENMKSHESLLGQYVACYTGFATDKHTRFKASSGGIVTALLIFLLENKYVDGAIVTKIEAGNPLLAKAFVAKSKDEIIAAMGSKYCPVLLNDALKTLEYGKRYVFVGLPCQTFAVKKLARFNESIKDSIKLYIGLFCGGGTPSYNGTIYLLRKYGLKGYDIQQIRYRGEGWPGHMQVQTKLDTLTIPLLEYWPLISPWFFLNICMICAFGLSPESDISCGDAWFPELIEKDKLGTSIIVSRTDFGDKILRRAEERNVIKLQQIPPSSVVKAQKSMIDFKHHRLSVRLRILRLFQKNYGIKPPAYSINRINLGDYFDEIALFIGRYLASRKNLWAFFDLYIIVLRGFYSFCTRLKKVI